MNLFSKQPDRSKILKTEASDCSFALRSSDLGIGAFKTWSKAREKVSWVRGLVCLAFVLSVPFATAIPQESIGNGLPYPPREPGLPPMNRTANPTADANRLMEDSMKLQDSRRRFEEINLQRQKDMTSYSAKLIEVARQLKTETDTGTPDAHSMIEIRQVELIEKLAHSIQNKMKASVSN